jgi:hypothetical protein
VAGRDRLDGQDQQSTQRWHPLDIKRVAIEAALSTESFDSLFTLPQVFAG